MSIEDKQEYLRSEIIELDYDGNQFAQFITEKKGTMDLQFINFEELKIVRI